jgi:hypothetical protein
MIGKKRWGYMGMTDRQYDDRQASLLRELERIENDIILIKEGKKDKSDTLERLKKDTEDFLKRP